jgi:hypothetical protein
MLENRDYCSMTDIQKTKYKKCTQNIWGNPTGKRSLKDSFKTDLCVYVEAEVHNESLCSTGSRGVTRFSFSFCYHIASRQKGYSPTQ